MHVSNQSVARLMLPAPVGWLVATAGLLAVFATYWDEAWHTDVGRDSAWAAPHLLLYGSVAVVGAGVAFWGSRVLVTTRSLRSTLARPPLLAAGLGALGALVAAPIDAFWHETYGRDAVLWSPPHMLVVLATTALILGVLAGLPAADRALRAVVGVLLLANAATVVFEYEADVPQFTETLYLPLLLLVGLPVIWVIRSQVPVRAPASTVVLGYVALRLVVAAGLVSLGRSAPDLPLAVIGLAAADLPLRRSLSRLAAAAVATSALAWSASALSLASPSDTAVAQAALPVGLLGLLVLVLDTRRGVVGGAVVSLTGLVAVAMGQEPAEGHDPGQGDSLTAVRMRAVSTVTGEVTLDVAPAGHCDDLAPDSVVARRAGATLTGRLEAVGDCTFRGQLTLPRRGRWFLYAEFQHEGAPTEAWVTVDGASASRLSEMRTLYLPPPDSGAVSTAQVVVGGLVYAGGLALVYSGVRAVRTSAPSRASSGAASRRE